MTFFDCILLAALLALLFPIHEKKEGKAKKEQVIDPREGMIDPNVEPLIKGKMIDRYTILADDGRVYIWCVSCDSMNGHWREKPMRPSMMPPTKS